MLSACVGTKPKPRHRSRARRHNNDNSAARVLRGTRMPMPVRTERMRSSPPSISPAMRNCSAARRWSSTRRAMPCSCRGVQVGFASLDGPTRVGERVGESFFPCVSRAMSPGSTSARVERRTPPGRRRVRRPLSQRPDRLERTRSQGLPRHGSARTALRSRRFASRRAPAP